MTTEAQIEANRANARRSTGPWTPDGKAIVARNAVKHGLLGEQTIVEGEDRARFARHRDAMLRALVPVAEVEVTLAERLIGLSWRLQRVQRLQVQAFEALCAGPMEDPAGTGADTRADEGADEELALGRIVVKDFSEGRVLDRLLMYERRLEHSLCRILGELRKERLFQNLEARTMDGGQPQVLLERLMGKLRDSPTAVLRMERGSARYEETPGDAPRVEGVEEVPSWKCQVSSQESQSPEPPGLPTSPCQLHPAAHEFSRQTNPIEEGSSLKCEVSSEESQSPEPAGLPTLPCHLPTAAHRFPRQTNPIPDGNDVGQALSLTGVTDDSSPDRPEKTKPICPDHPSSIVNPPAISRRL